VWAAMEAAQAAALVHEAGQPTQVSSGHLGSA